jgi:thiamine biosynthesis protein ThiC
VCCCVGRRCVLQAEFGPAKAAPAGLKSDVRIGNSATANSIAEQVERMMWSVCWGAGTVMELPTGKHIRENRGWILRNSQWPISTSSTTP